MKRHIAPVALALCALGAATSCNKEKETPTETEQETALSMAVTNFRLQANAKILEHLDSVYFSIDLNHRVIFNADSLPKGTKVDKLIPVITYPSDVSAAELRVDNGTVVNTIDYKENPSDSIDFTNPVTLTLTAADGETRISYTLKVNVHRNDPDSIIWDQLARRQLPARMAAPVAQKTVMHDGRALCIIEENDGTHTLATSDNLFTSTWTKTPLALPSAMRLSTLCSTSSALYMLADDGTLYSSADGSAWTATGERWSNIVGAYGDVALGIGGDAASGLRHVHYPAGGDITDSPLEADFPISGYSAFSTISSKWADEPIGLMTGGRLADGTLTSATWGFDGDSWARLDTQSQPPVEGAAVFPYYAYRQTTSSWVQTEFNVWVLMGGRLADGSPNGKVYLSYNNGVNWAEAPQLMQLPPYFTPGSGADALVMETPLDANLSDAWATFGNPARKPWMRIAYNIDGYEISWQCPYIYILGGIGSDGRLSDTIWRGVLARLTYTPLI